MDGHVDVARLLLDHGAQVQSEFYFRTVFQKGQLCNAKVGRVEFEEIGGRMVVLLPNINVIVMFFCSGEYAC